MTGLARAVVLGVAGLLTLGGVVVQISGASGWPLVLPGALIGASVLLEGRYKRLEGQARGSWQRTGEREVDSETGRVVEVWFDPATGRRHYLPSPDP